MTGPAFDVWLGFLADLMLAAAALYVSGQALRGWLLEEQAERLPDGEEKRRKIADARTFYAMASLSKAWVLLCIFLGTAIKLVLGVIDGPWS